MWKIVIALALILGGICYGSSISVMGYNVETCCVENKKYVIVGDVGSFNKRPVAIAQVIDFNGYPERCK